MPKKWMPLDEYLRMTEKEDTMEKRTINLTGSGVGRGDPSMFGIAPGEIRTTHQKKFTPSTHEWKQIINNCLAEPREWFNRKLYYNNREAGNSGSSYAALFNRQGETRSKVDTIGKTIREVIATHGGTFYAQYTRVTTRTDDPDKGAWMHMVFVRWVPDKVVED